MTHSTKMTLGFAAASLLLPPLAAWARDFTPAFRACMQSAYDERELALNEARAQFYDDILDAFEERRQRYAESWNQEDDGDQRRMEREADRDFRERVRDIDDAWDDAEDDARDTFRERRRECRNLDDDDDDGIFIGERSSRSRSSRSSAFSFGFGHSSSNPFLRAPDGF